MDKELFAVQPVDGGVQVEMGKKVAKSWGRLLRRLEKGYVRGNLFYPLHEPRWVLTRPAFLRHIYPDMAESRRESKKFRRRHQDVLADRELVKRVRARWVSPTPFVLTHAEVDEWIAVAGQARRLCELLWWAGPGVKAASLVQELLVFALDPEAFAASPSKPVAAGQAATDQTV